MRKKSFLQKLLQQTIGIASILWLLIGCGVPSTNVPTEERRADDLSSEDIATLSSLEKVDNYPLYTMRYYGSYTQVASSARDVKWRADANILTPNLTTSRRAWGCSLFAALGDADNLLYGRNFDWKYTPAVLLFTDPPDGYASVSIVSSVRLGFEETVDKLTDLPLIKRRVLLKAPFIPFDGMNEHGLAVGMAAVPSGKMRPDPDKETIGALMVIRKMLDYASNVDEAVAIMQSYNINMGKGPPVHYLIADRSGLPSSEAKGRAVLVEFYRGKTIIIPNKTSWHQATNFFRAATGENAERKCWRYDKIYQRLAKTEGKITAQNAIVLLKDISLKGTQWSIVYGMSTGNIKVTMGRQYDKVHTFHLNLVDE